MKAKSRKTSVRRQPKQRRARQTVEAVLDAVARVLKRDGVDAVTTNRIAEVAGVSIGSVYQYFPDKRAIFVALHQRHVEQMSRIVESRLIEHATSSLDDLMRALVDAMVDAHATDPELHELLLAEVPHRAEGARDFEGRLGGALRLAISSRAQELARPRDLDKILFVLTQLIESLSHAVVLRRPAHLSLASAKQEAVHAVLAYLRAGLQSRAQQRPSNGAPRPGNRPQHQRKEQQRPHQ
jgi:AcrR family transcriptional regulator